ncbi:MAG: tetratricopeptide repeat protein [Flavobacterium sp.]|nr:tetratricopeptide repeat protein [Flavobacterium sp.]
MKKYTFVLLLVFQISFAQNAFEKGNQLYKSQNYQEAITNYESILASGKQSAALYFNLGNCYYKLHKVAPSIYNYEKALQLNPDDNQIQTNLDFARKTTLDDLKIVPKVGFSKIIKEFTSRYHFDTWAWISVGFSFIVLLFFVGYYFSETTVFKRVFFSLMFTTLILLFISLISGFFEKNKYLNEKPAIIFSEKCALKKESKLSSKDLLILHEGTKVFILESVAGWKKVQLTDESIGWIQDNTFKELR